jgi:alkylation response protein AidB-like acyl-CoA dehydrogenase
VLTGQKLWNNSLGATFMLALVRTDPAAARHDGISALIVDLRAPGVDVRPVRQISGDLDFAEVFFTDVRVPVADRVGAEGQGWKLAMSTLAYERGPADIGHVSRLGRILTSLDDAWRAGTLRDVPDAGLRLARAHVEVEVLRLKVLESLSARRVDGVVPGPEGSLDKLLLIRTEQRLLATLLELAGGALVRDDGDVLAEYFQSRAASIRGGTEQVQRGIVATRLLGLPEPARRPS